MSAVNHVLQVVYGVGQGYSFDHFLQTEAREIGNDFGGGGGQQLLFLIGGGFIKKALPADPVIPEFGDTDRREAGTAPSKAITLLRIRVTSSFDIRLFIR